VVAVIVKVSSKGQIVLPAEIRKKYGIELGSHVDIVEHAGSLYLVPLGDGDPLDQLTGLLAGVPGFSTEEFLAERRRERDRENEEMDRWAR
jgi:AbrB family looped-hinge helix DNA binding protein